MHFREKLIKIKLTKQKKVIQVQFSNSTNSFAHFHSNSAERLKVRAARAQKTHHPDDALNYLRKKGNGSDIGREWKVDLKFLTIDFFRMKILRIKKLTIC